MSMIPRLSFEQLRPDLGEALRPRVERLGYLGEFFRLTGHEPDALLAFNALTAALKEALPDDLTEVVALTVAGRLNNAYERNQHERLALKLGFSDAWVAQVEHLLPDEATDLTEMQRAAQRLTISAVDGGGNGSSAPLQAFAEKAGPRSAIALLMLVGRYISHAVIVNAFELEPPVQSIFQMGAVR